VLGKFLILGRAANTASASGAEYRLKKSLKPVPRNESRSPAVRALPPPKVWLRMLRQPGGGRNPRLVSNSARLPASCASGSLWTSYASLISLNFPRRFSCPWRHQDGLARQLANLRTLVLVPPRGTPALRSNF
jgi:hypothetical protein